MKVAIISDTHDNLAALEKAVSWMEKNNIKEIIHCGDICRGETIKWLAENFPNKIHLVFGNIDEDKNKLTLAASKYSNIALHGDIGGINAENLKIAFCHKPNLARQLAQTGKYNLVFYGHTHQPWEEKVNNCRLINPGNLSNMLYKASFAVYDAKTDKLELKLLEKLQ
jgi:putative phosphoesterase